MDERTLNELDHYKAQEVLQEQQQDAQREIYAPQMQEQMAQAQSVVIAETDPKKDIKELLNEFRGLEMVDGELKKIRESVLNAKGVDRIAFILRPLMINTIRFTRLKEHVVNKFTVQIVNDVIIDLGVNWREYGITERSTCDHIVDAIATLVFSILSRAIDQNEKNWIKGISFENIGAGSKLDGIGKKEGWLDKFKF